MANKINGIDVSKLVLTVTNNDVYYSQKVVDELQNTIKRLQEENEKLKEEKEKIEEDTEYFLNGDYCDEKCNSAKNELKYKQALEEIREIVTNTCRQRCTNDCLGTKKHCGYGKILTKTKEI